MPALTDRLPLMPRRKCDFIIVDATGLPSTAWPGVLPYRGRWSERGYSSRKVADERLRVVNRHYNAKEGCSPGQLRVVKRCD